MRIVLWAIAVGAAIGWASAADVNYTPVEPEALMPDGSPFLAWADQTVYSKTYHVNQHHPSASDDNPGTAERPFRTINRAAQEVGAGERVWIHAGIYRDMVQPRLSGESPDRMIAYEAVPGEEVIIKGSRALEGGWVASRDPQGRGTYSKKLWMITLSESLFQGGYFPFRTPNASDEEIDLMPWALAWKGRIPCVTQFETQRQTKAGRLIDVSVTASPIRDAAGQIIGVSKIARDITEQKRVHEELRRSEARLASAQRIARIGNWEMDLISQKPFWSDEIFNIFGIRRAEFGADYEAFMKRVHPADRDRMTEARRPVSSWPRLMQNSYQDGAVQCEVLPVTD